MATAGLPPPSSAASPPATPAAPVAERILPAQDGGSTWPWLLTGLLAVGALGFAGWSWWRRQQPLAPVKVPQVERPRLSPQPAAQPSAPEIARVPTEPLQVTLEPLRLSLTLLNATLAYRLEIANRGAAAITDLRIGADMISAHASMSREEQLAGPGASAAPQQRIERLEPGESRVVAGEFRVPFTQIVPIRQGQASLLVPLARFKLEAAGAAPVVRTFAVGQAGQGAGLQPFRLDLGPRVYPKLAQRAFA